MSESRTNTQETSISGTAATCERDASHVSNQARSLLEGPLRHVRGASLAAMLVPLAMAGTSPAEASAIDPCRTSRVDAEVTAGAGDGSQYLYEFTVFNTSPSDASGACGINNNVIVDWELPLFSPGDIVAGSLTSPNEWWRAEVIPPGQSTFPSGYYKNPDGPYGNYEWDYAPGVDPLLDPGQGGDPNLYGPTPGMFINPPLIVHWYTCDGDWVQDPDCEVILASSPVSPIAAGQNLGGFSFLSDYAPQNAPYLTSWFQEPPTSGDPPSPGGTFGIPGSPEFFAAQGQSDPTPVPEPAALALLGAGAAMLGIRRRRRGLRR